MLLASGDSRVMADEDKNIEVTKIILTNGESITVEGTVENVVNGIEGVTTPRVPLIKLVDAKTSGEESETSREVWINANQIVEFHEHRPGSWRMM